MLEKGPTLILLPSQHLKMVSTYNLGRETFKLSSSVIPVPEAPQNVIAEDTGSSFRVSWGPPERANGILLNYEVMYSIPNINVV